MNHHHRTCTSRGRTNTTITLLGVAITNHNRTGSSIRALLNAVYQTVLVHTRKYGVPTFEDDNISYPNTTAILKSLGLRDKLWDSCHEPSFPPCIKDGGILLQDTVELVGDVDRANRAPIIVSAQFQSVGGD